MASDNIDKDGFRANVAMVICNDAGQLLLARRRGQRGWQFPQGGIQNNERPQQAMYRELFEEVGLRRRDVEILARSRSWLRYRLPARYRRKNSTPLCIGQKQRWYLLRLVGDEKNICFDSCEPAEFEEWKWVDYDDPAQSVIFFKRKVYAQALEEFRALVDAAAGR